MLERPALCLVATLLCACPSGVSQSGSAGRGEPAAEPVSETAAASAGCADCGAAPSGALGTAWHPDPDGDGVASARDLCPTIYDPAQADTDADGVGDACDPNAARPEPGGAVVDLHAEHVTPYGAWLNFRSVRDLRYAWKATLAWSTERAGVATAKGFAASVAAGRTLALAGYERAGHPLRQPIVLIDLEPATTYYLAVRTNDTGAIGNVLEIQTHAAPLGALTAARPRMASTPAAIKALRARVEGGDRAWRGWSAVMGARVSSVVRQPDKPSHHAYCPAAAVLYRATGKARYLAEARSLLTGAVSYWEANALSGNAYRWANAVPALCLDLLWDDIDARDRNAIVATVLADDEAHLGELREADTDRTASIARSLVVDGLLACGATDVDPALAQRACKVLQRGLRIFYGMQLVKARRDRGFWAQSGATLPDGTHYMRGTVHYWLETFAALTNAGAELGDYAPWIENSLAAFEIYPLTPRRRGFSTFGDVESYRNPEEPNSMPIAGSSAGTIALRAGLLAAAGRTRAAGYARYALGDAYEREHAPGAWHALLADHDGIAPRSYREELPLAYLDSGVGLFYDRSSWDEDASMLVFRAGWGGVDHSHEDIGAFQLYRQGRWVTHEALGYGGPAAEAKGHSVLALAVVGSKGVERMGQLVHAGAGGMGVVRASSSGGGVSYAAADTRGAYVSDQYRSYRYAAVQRHLVWIEPAKPGDADRVIVYDLVDNAAGETGHAREWQLHLDAAPTIRERTATAVVGDQRVRVDIALPVDARLAAHPPEGVPHEYPGQIYTHRLTANPGVAPSLRMVAVIHAASAKAPAAEAPVTIDGDDWLGVVSGEDAVVFPRAPLPAGWPAPAAAELRVPAAATRLVWTGLAAAASYRVEAKRDGDEVAIALTPGGDHATDSGGVLTLALP